MLSDSFVFEPLRTGRSNLIIFRNNFINNFF